MKNGRLFWNGVLLSLPAVMLVGAVAYFLVDKVPQLERNERKRVQQEYRERAIEAKEKGDGEEFDFEKSGLKKGAFKDRREPLGFERDFVWYFKEGKAYRVSVEPVEGFDFSAVFYPVGIGLMLLFVGMTAFGIRYFWKFVKSRDDFLAATAHDLTTPLVGMRMMIGRADDEAKRLNERMLLIVSNIKDFLKLGGKRRQPDLKPVDIVALTKEAYQLFAADYTDSESGDVTFHCSPSPSTYTYSVLADETMTLQILWNLFGNDLKYAAPYGKVEVRFAQEGNFVRAEFVDEGQGMTPQQMKKAFDRYYRAKTVLESVKGGFGIGLCTAREFARAMNGDLTVRANTPKGCVFTFSLPMRSGQETGRASPIAGAIAPLA